jgi:hypothetical protein
MKFFKKIKIESIVVIALIATFSGCQSEFDFTSLDSIDSPKNNYTWQDQLNLLIKNKDPFLSSQGLTLIKFEIEEKIDPSVIISTINKDLLVPAFLDPVNFNSFELIVDLQV